MGCSLSAPFSVKTRQQAADVVGKGQDFGGVVEMAEHPGDLDLGGEFGEGAAGDGDEVGVFPGTVTRAPFSQVAGDGDGGTTHLLGEPETLFSLSETLMTIT